MSPKEMILPNPELSINPRVIEALRGTVSEPTQAISHRPGHPETMTVRLAKEGAGMFDLTGLEDNKEWSGITNHVLLSARYSVYFAQKMTEKRYNVNPQRILDGMIASHAGRRQWDEAGWYPEAVEKEVGKEEKEKRRSVSNETLGIQLIENQVPRDAFELVVALGHNVEGFSVDPSIYDSWDFKIAIYVDHRTTQKYEALNTRMGDFLLGNFFKREDITPELKTRVYDEIESIIERQKNYRLGKDNAQAVSLDDADEIAKDLGASEGSDRLPRKELMRLILQDADTEAALINANINPDGINDETVPMPKWEHEFRVGYVKCAEEEIFSRINQLLIENNLKDLDEEFPKNSWWGWYAINL